MKAYKGVKTGDSLDKNTLCGPLMGDMAVKIYEDGLKEI